ncbi:hypothetical protein BS17DRAFT_764167 [Gyrodon lividus]|nr:hypothetical protein BS17DRAFT_764167 [Gyrodon lividus]
MAFNFCWISVLEKLRVSVWMKADIGADGKVPVLTLPAASCLSTAWTFWLHPPCEHALSGQIPMHHRLLSPKPHSSFLRAQNAHVIEHKGKSSASGSHFIAPATQAPSASSSSVQLADPWALYLKVQSLVQMTAGSWAIAAHKTNVHQILCLLMELQHLKERLNDAMEQQNYLQDTLGLMNSLSQLYEECLKHCNSSNSDTRNDTNAKSPTVFLQWAHGLEMATQLQFSTQPPNRTNAEAEMGPWAEHQKTHMDRHWFARCFPNYVTIGCTVVFPNLLHKGVEKKQYKLECADLISKAVWTAFAADVIHTLSIGALY